MVSSTPLPLFTPGKHPVPVVQETGWAPGPVWTDGKSRPHRDSIPDRPARSSVAILTEPPGPQNWLLYFRIFILEGTVTNWLNLKRVSFVIQRCVSRLCAFISATYCIGLAMLERK